jgi:hypothetical protein
VLSLLCGCRKHAQPDAEPAVTPAAEHHICTYISRDEVEAVLGSPVTDGVEEGTRCTFSPGEGAISGAVIDVTWHGGSDAMRHALARKQAFGLTAQSIPGVGDEAMFGLPSTLYVRKGDSFLMVDVHPSDNPQEKSVQIAQKVLQRF